MVGSNIIELYKTPLLIWNNVTQECKQDYFYCVIKTRLDFKVKILAFL